MESFHSNIGLLALAAAAVVPLATVWMWRSTSKKIHEKKEENKPSPVQQQPTVMESSNGTNDVWAERRQRGIAAASSHVKKNAATEKPFGSKYYYAHNNSNVTGGYKDGLTMEDYSMNGPRLLSRGGKPVQDECAAGEEKAADASGITRPVVQTKKRTLPISKYLWDDPGDSGGIATIRIDELPSRTGSEMKRWSELRQSIQNISATLVDRGMEVSLETNMEIDFTLRIAEFYGEVGEVEAVSKAKRLLIRIKKKRGLLHRSNTESWPHPQKKKL